MKKFLVLIILSIFVVPLAGVIPGHVWTMQYTALVFMFCLSAGVILWDFNKYLSMFSLMFLFSAFFVANIDARSMILLIQFNAGCLLAYGISRFEEHHRKIIVRAVFCFLILQMSLLALQVFNLDPFFHSLIDRTKDDMVGFSGSRDHIGTYFALTTPTVLSISPFLAPICAFGLTASKSSFAYISAIIAGLIYLYYTKNKLFYILLPIAIICSSIFIVKIDKLKSADFDMRFNVWKYAVKATIDGEIEYKRNGVLMKTESRPMFGYGLGAFYSIFPFIPQSQTVDKDGKSTFNFRNEKFTHAHNDFVELFFETGYLGIMLFLLLLVNFIRGFLKTPKTKELTLYFSTIVAYLLNATGNFLSHVAVPGLILIIFYGLYEGARREYER